MARHRYALVACARWEEDSIAEWLEYHRSVGFDHVYLYSNDDDPTTLLKAVMPYALGDDPYVTYRHWPEGGKQIQIYLHFLAQFKHETEWFAFLDIDEFFVFKNSDNVHSFMRDYAETADCVYFNWVCFGNDGNVTRSGGPTLTSYRRRARDPDVHTKMLCRSAALDAFAIRRRFERNLVSFWHFLDAYGFPGLRCVNVLHRPMDGYSADFPASAAPFVERPNFAGDILDRAYIAHYQFRSEQDFMRRWRRGGSAFAGHWRTVFETGQYREILAQRNEVPDTYLAEYWQRHTGQVPGPDAPAPRDEAVDRPVDNMYGDGMGPVGICAAFKDEAPYLLEWIAYHLSTGFDHIVLYDNGSTDGGVALVAASPFAPFVSVVDWPERPGQLSAYQHFSEHYAQSFEWAAFIDLDEFVHPLEHTSIRDLLPRYKGMGGVSIQWLTFGASGHVSRPPGLTIEHYDMRLPGDHPRCSWVKSLVRTANLVGITKGPHIMEVTGNVCNARGEVVRPYSQLPPCHDVMVINHYYTRSREDWDAKQRRGHVGNPLRTHYSEDDFNNHDRGATVPDDRIKRFVPIVKQALAAGPAGDLLPVRLGEPYVAVPDDAPAGDPSGLVAVELAAPAIAEVPEPGDVADGPVIHIDPNGGRLANQMIQYMVAYKFASLVPGCRISNVDIPEWGIALPPIESDGPDVRWDNAQLFDMDGLTRRTNDGEIRRLTYCGFGQRMEYFPELEVWRRIFQAPRHQGVGYGPEYLLCHVRADDILSAIVTGYVLTPVEFYQEIVAQTGLQPVFMGETGPSLYMSRIREAFPNATVLPKRDIIEDFETIRQSENIVVSCSTFCWLAAWLSHAKQIIMPVNGIFNPRQDHRINLLPFGDPRYRFHLFPLNWAVKDDAHPERHKALAGLWREVPHEHLRTLLTEAPRVPRRIEPFLEVFEEDYYVGRFTSVAKGVTDGWLASGRVHYTNWGFKDGYGWWCFDLDEVWYCAEYPMAAFEIAQGDYADARHHYVEIGRRRGYRRRKDMIADRIEPAPAAHDPAPAKVPATPAEQAAATLHFVYRNSDAPVFFLPSLMIGEGHKDVAVAPDNRAPPDQPYVCVVTVWDFWRLDPRRCVERDIPHFSASIDKELVEDIRRGRAILALDLTNEGPEFERWAFDRIHEVIDALRLPARRVVWLAQNRVIAEYYEAAYKDTREELIRFEYYDFYVKSFAHRFADAEWRRHTMGDDETYQRNLLDPANKDRIALCLNATPRQHRLFAIAALRFFGLFDDCLVSFGGLDYAKGRTMAEKVIAATDNSKEFSWLSDEIRTVVTLPKLSIDSFQETGNSLWNKIDVQSYYRTFLSLVTETDFSDGEIDRVSEKIVKAFCLGHPTLVLGNPLNIRMMGDWGFDVFDGVFDQRYDGTVNPGARFRQVFKELSRQVTPIRTDPAGWLDRVREASIANLKHSHGGFLRTYRAQCDRTVIDNFKRMLAETNPS